MTDPTYVYGVRDNYMGSIEDPFFTSYEDAKKWMDDLQLSKNDFTIMRMQVHRWEEAPKPEGSN